MIATLKTLFKAASLTGLAVGCSAIAALTAYTSANAQQAAPKPSWAKICSSVGETDICNVQYNIITNTGQLVTAVNLMQTKGKTNRRIFQVAVPSGRYVAEGIKVQIDRGKQNTLPYTICFPDRCLAEIQLSEGLVKALKAGGEITLTSTNFRAQKNPVKVSLQGFTAAFDGAPLRRYEVETRNKALQDALRKKTQAAADKLKAAQDAAKRQSN